MVPIILIKNFWFFGKRAIGVTFFPFIFLKKSFFDTRPDTLQSTINHEQIHIQQQKELLLLPFYLWYFTEYLIKACYMQNPYRSLSFEREAYANETDYNYLEKRRAWSFLKYL